MTPVLCPQCRAENRIATVNGPTCPHQAKTGADWFPPWWGDRPFAPESEPRRIAHLEFIQPQPE
jgi:hypothetical protein